MMSKFGERNQVVLPGKSFEWRPARAGEIAEIGNDVEKESPPAWIGVFDHPFFDVTSADGIFVFRRVPPGRHRVVAFHPVLGRREAEVIVVEGRVATASLLFTAEQAP